MIKLNDFTIKTKRGFVIEVSNLEFMQKGKFEGYVVGTLYGEDGRSASELLFRLHDPDNGPDCVLVSYDTCYNNEILEKHKYDIKEQMSLNLKEIYEDTYKIPQGIAEIAKTIRKHKSTRVAYAN